MVESLVVVRATRENSVAAAAPANPHFATAREVLSYKPEEPLPLDLHSRLAQMDILWAGGGDFTSRIEAAQARLILGRGDGLALRTNLWNSGLPEQVAKETRADYQNWHIKELLCTWEPWIEHIHRCREEVGLPVDEDMIYMVPMMTIAALVAAGLWSTEGPDPDKIGHLVVVQGS